MENIIKEEMVSFATAKLAKEKGFSVPTNMYYENSLTEQIHEEDGTSGPFGWERGEINLQSGYFINNWKESDFSNKSWYMCSAPTQSLLQKWLRDKHKLVLTIDYLFDSKDESYHVFTYSLYSMIQKARNAVKGINVQSKLYHSYEEALEEGLTESLKLIKK